MGVYIPNMSKPKSCAECELWSNCFYPKAPKEIDNKVMPDCPLIEIIPCKECKNSHMTYGGECKYCDLIRDDDDNFIECYFEGDYFCGYGERRNDEHNTERD